MAGNIKRDKLKSIKDKMEANNETTDESKLTEMLPEKEVTRLLYASSFKYIKTNSSIINLLS